MDQFMLQLGRMSLQACVVIGVVLLIREIFARTGITKKYINILWMLPYLCMLCPWKLEGAFGFWRQAGGSTDILASKGLAETLESMKKTGLTEEVTQTATEAFHNMEAVESLGENIGESIGDSLGILAAPARHFANLEVLQVLLTIAFAVWVIGVIGLVIYCADTHLKLHIKLICSMHIKENIYIAEGIMVPFVMGIFKPRIYLPVGMSEADKWYVIAHEKTHIKHLDPLKKALAFGITCLHWFNPMAWAAFYYYSKDMEMACDEETVQRLGMEHRKNYARTLLALSIGKRLFLGAPLAFDEGNVKSRVKNIVKYKKTWKVSAVAAVAVIIVLTALFMTEYKEYVPLSKVQDLVHPPKEMVSKAIIITVNGETKYFSGEGNFDKISTFLKELEIKKEPKDRSRDQNRSKDIVVEFGATRFCFDAECTTIWCDNDVKASFTYQVENPQEVKTYWHDLFDGVPVVDKNIFTGVQIETIVPEIKETETQETEVKETVAKETEPTTELSELERIARDSEMRELTMEELIALHGTRPEVLAQTVEPIPWGEEGPTVPAIYHNLEVGFDYEGEWNGNYFAYLTHEGKEYHVQFGFDKKTKALWGVYLFYATADDVIVLYTDDPQRYTVAQDIQEFLGREYNMDDYFTCTLPENTSLGNFKVYYNDILSGCPIWGDFEEQLHGEWAPEPWLVPGCVLIAANNENNSLMKFENGKAVSIRWLGNHLAIASQSYIEGCSMQAILCEMYFDIFTVPEAEEYKAEHKLSDDELETVSKYWYVFMGEEDSEYIYVVGLNQKYFTKEDVIALAESVQIAVE